MPEPVVGSFCCCCNLKQGGTTIGIFGVIISSISIACFAYNIASIPTDIEKAGSQAKDDAMQWLQWIRTLAIVHLVISCFTIAFATLLFIGICTDTAFFVLPDLIWKVLRIALGFFELGYTIYVFEQFRNYDAKPDFRTIWSLTYALFVIYLIVNIVVLTYFAIVIYSLYNELKYPPNPNSPVPNAKATAKK